VATIEYGTWADARPADTNEGDLTTAGATVEYIGYVTVTEQGGTDKTYRIAVSNNGSGVAADASEFIRYDTPLLANLSHEVPVRIGNSQTVRIRSSSADSISFVLSGMKKTA